MVDGIDGDASSPVRILPSTRVFTNRDLDYIMTCMSRYKVRWGKVGKGEEKR